MAVFAGSRTTSVNDGIRIWPNQQAYITVLPFPTGDVTFGSVSVGAGPNGGNLVRSIVPVIVNQQYADRGDRSANTGKAPIDGMGVGFDWFERIHPKPQRLDLGNVVSDVTQFLELYNAYRLDDRVWTTFVNNAGAGVTVDNLPALPKTIPNQSSFEVQVTVTPNGPPTIDGTLDFAFDAASISVPITGTRIILFALPPSDGTVQEKLSWLTDVIKASDGTEQRLSARLYPRQEISFSALTVRDFDRNQLNAFLFDWQSNIFGVPLWWDARVVDQNVAVNDVTIHVANTQWADFRVGGLAVIISFDEDGNRTADTLEISAVSASPSIVTFTSGAANAYTAGRTMLVPVVPGVLNNGVRKARAPATQQTTRVSFTALDNDNTSLVPDASVFNSFNDRVVIDDPNCIGKELAEGYTKTITRVDGDTGEILQSSTEDRSTPTTAKRWNVDEAQRLWEIKSMLYAIRGQQVSFYLPTFNKDLVPVDTVGIGGSTIDIENIGYTQFIRDREPFSTIAVILKPGAGTRPSPEVAIGSPVSWIPGQDYLFFDIIGSTEVSTTVERISISPAAPVGFLPEDVERIEFIVKSRFASDSAELIHRWTDALGDQIDSQISLPVLGVYDD